ncbi:xanthine dehydrogenase family protein molybdopterin-binding subunit [Pseudomonas matsuisoli]|uniref:Aldehyde oxidase n=1 Tax=Pseudomonas matsuisoli TaxID=1515666 RepID=A0A917V011_9PSED|nr:xanthine dehydrogenase family protein molybdopterin-binding subunit [Pseudomonas matsuisoli]GGK02839.1 aldehyde oxidase [Pseudomonas matsuisoli]
MNDIIGAAPKRVDGRLKVTGKAQYAADHGLDRMAFAYGVYSTIANGRVTRIDVDEARRMPGVLDIFHHGHFADLYRPPSMQMNPAQIERLVKVDETRLPFEDDRVYYAGQFVAIVVADSFEQARAAAYKVKVDYKEEPAVATLGQAKKAQSPQSSGSDYSRGNAATAFDSATKKIDATYTTPVETHNPMEMHATTAYWEGDRLFVYEATQSVVVHRNTLARIFGLSPDKVELRAPFIGSGFGGKLWAWPHSAATCAAARAVKRPVQFVLPRPQMFTTVGHRPETEQRMRLATDSKGKLVSVRHESINGTSFTDPYSETCGSVTKSLYSCPNLAVTHSTLQVHHGTPTSMRAPGAAPGLFALESAMDEMAEAIGMDPLAFRKLNASTRDEGKDLPWSSNHLQEAFDKGAAKFGWDKRTPAPGSMREGHEIIGYGVAACNWDALRCSSDARVSLRADGTAFVTCGAQDIGTGTYTIVAQTVSKISGLPLEKITVQLGDSSFPPGPVSGGSWATASILPAVAEATRDAIEQLKGFAVENGPFKGADAKALQFAEGRLVNGNDTLDFGHFLREQRLGSAEGEAHTGVADGDVSIRSFGVHFVEVRWDPGISRLRVARVVSAIDAGQVINEKAALNQVEGAIVMAIGMAMFEATHYDERNGRPTNNDYAEYMVPVHADQPPEMDIMLLDYPDYALNEFGARGIGEIGTTGLAAAIANAVHHATGKRIRDLPITLDKLMEDAPRVTA